MQENGFGKWHCRKNDFSANTIDLNFHPSLQLSVQFPLREQRLAIGFEVLYFVDIFLFVVLKRVFVSDGMF